MTFSWTRNIKVLIHFHCNEEWKRSTQQAGDIAINNFRSWEHLIDVGVVQIFVLFLISTVGTKQYAYMTSSLSRISVIGCTGCGKTTVWFPWLHPVIQQFSKKLSKKSGKSHVELDAINWKENWTPNPNFLRDVQATLSDKKEWIVDGNNEKSRDFVWRNADCVVWLDFSFFVIIWRLLRRTFSRLLWREKLWNGNKEVTVNVKS